MNGERFDSVFGYHAERPVKCCANCAFFDFTENCVSCQCSLKAGFGQDLSEVETCGICSRWLSRQVSITAKTCTSLEEFRLKRDVIDENAYTPELDEWFSERKATKRMIDLVLKMRRFVADWLALAGQVESKQRSSPPVFSQFPLMVKPDCITENGIITQLYSSDSFWSVHYWISENKPVFDEWLGYKRECAKCQPSRLAVDLL